MCVCVCVSFFKQSREQARKTRSILLLSAGITVSKTIRRRITDAEDHVHLCVDGWESNLLAWRSSNLLQEALLCRRSANSFHSARDGLIATQIRLFDRHINKGYNPSNPVHGYRENRVHFLEEGNTENFHFTEGRQTKVRIRAATNSCTRGGRDKRLRTTRNLTVWKVSFCTLYQT